MTIETKWLHAPDDLSPVFSIREAGIHERAGLSE